MDQILVLESIGETFPQVLERLGAAFRDRGEFLQTGPAFVADLVQDGLWVVGLEPFPQLGDDGFRFDRRRRAVRCPVV